MEKATQAPRARSEKKRPLALGKVYDLVCERWDDGLEKMKLGRVKEELESAIALENASIPEYPGVKITSLSLKEVESSLGLEVDRSDFELLHVEPVKSPQLLVDYLALIQAASSRSARSEAVVRWKIDALILNSHAIARTRTPYASPVNINAERSFSHGPVFLHGKSVSLTARTYYGIWCGEEESIGLNVAVVEAKSRCIGYGRTQTLGYMGCIHRERKKFPKKDCTVYGVVSDGVDFEFLKISDDSKWSYRSIQRDCIGGTTSLDLPLGLLVYIFCRAALASPCQPVESSYQTLYPEGSGECTPMEPIQEDEETRD